MDLHPTLETQNRGSALNEESVLTCYVAGGTIFLDVVVWKIVQQVKRQPAHLHGESHQEEEEEEEEEVHPLFLLKGHQGSIHTVRWGHDALTLASGSDDRTLRIWTIPSAIESDDSLTYEVLQGSLTTRRTIDVASPPRPPEIQPRHVLFGHVARLWGTCFSADGKVVVSCSEDGSCRVWEVTNGKCLGIIQVFLKQIHIYIYISCIYLY